jgi:vacuolar-type H+-ATPase subunit E/Vma4
MQAVPLLELMTRQVSQQREEILAKAQAQADVIAQQAQERAERRRTETLEAVDAEVRAASKRARERAEAAAHMVVMTTKDAIADEVLSNVRERLRRIAEGPEFPAVLRALLSELMAGAPGGDIVVLAPSAHADQCRAWLSEMGRESVAVEVTASLRDGVALQDRARTFRITNTLSRRFDKREGDLRRHCLHELFGEGA